MRVIDITAPLNETIKVYQGDPRFSKKPICERELQGYELHHISMGTHTGTHVDAPRHFFAEGATVDQIPLTRFYGKCAVISRFEEIVGYKRVLLKGTINVLTELQAQILVDAGIRLVGTERLSIGSDKVHKILLSNDCLILECLELDNVRLGEYTLCAPPLKMETDGAPLRAFLIEEG